MCFVPKIIVAAVYTLGHICSVNIRMSPSSYIIVSKFRVSLEKLLLGNN